MGQSTSDFFGTERFRIRRRLGSGGMGVVYEAHDRDTDKVVALKALTRTEAIHISRFKNEFRSLADVAHPNLISLYEFMSDGEYWFFTMELVKGVNFLEFVRPGYQARRTPASITPTLLKNFQVRPDEIARFEAETAQLDFDRPTISDEVPQDSAIDISLSLSHLDVDRLKVALRQLAEGLHGLHQTGKLHRDIKPSNVLVTEEGRVVILDFGLVADLEGQGIHDNVKIAGTPDYMSPEQGAQLVVTPASDWYSVGVILYQAITGRLPFAGDFFEVMASKQNLDPPSPESIAPDVPTVLSDLTMRLLQRDPDMRPTGREVLRILGRGKTGPLSRPITPSTLSGTTEDIPFIGRQRYFGSLWRAFAATRKGQTVSVYLHGESGLGKTALVREFLDDLKTDNDQIVILEGRCYERESMPYKALDGVVDSLTKYLLTLPEKKASELMPRDIQALARLFPVMLQVDCVFNAPRNEQATPDAFSLRRRAFSALRDLLGRISDRQPLVIWIDDLQWSDHDSAALLSDLLRPPDAPAILLILSFRSEDIETRPFLQSLLDNADGKTRRELEAVPLDDAEAAKLVRKLLESQIQPTEEVVLAIVREARGNPFLMEQLAHYATTSYQTETAGISLADMLEVRLGHMPPGAREFVSALAIAARPISAEVAFQAAGLEGDEQPLVSSLRAAQFLRSGGSEYGIELYHDRIRETLSAQLDEATVRQIHRRLAQAIESVGLDAPDALFEHYLGAGERVRAATHAAAAARKAANTLAFDRAAVFYRRALDLAPARGIELIELKRGLADALANAGRPSEAAAVYLDLAQNTSASRSLDFRRRAAEQLLMGGHLDEGMEVLQSVLAAVGFTLPRGVRHALFSLTLRRLQIRLRGLNFTERDAGQIPEADLLRIDICWAMAAGLGVVDLILGADFQSRHLLLALKAGEPHRVARAMAFEAAQAAVRGAPTRERALQIANRAEELAQQVRDPHAIGLSIWAKGVGAYLVGDWKKAAELCEQAAELLRDQCTGVTWELTIAQRFMLGAKLYLGEIGEVARRVRHLLSNALEQGNLFAATDLRTRMNLIWLAADDPNRARAEVISALTNWPHEGFHLQHYSSLAALAQIELYTDDADVAWKHFEGQLKPLETSMLLRIQVLRIEVRQLRARTALASATGKYRESRLRVAARMAKKIFHEGLPYAAPISGLIDAAVACSRGDLSQATNVLNHTLEGFELTKMALYAAVTRRRLGQLLGGDAGAQLITQADEWMASEHIRNPKRMTQVLAPGFGTSER